jgi:hypothetical protein
MIRCIISFALLGCLSAMTIGCGGKKTAAPRNDSDVPDFVLNPPKEIGVIFGTGIAEQQSPQLAKETADLRARKEIATILSSKVSSMFKDFLSQAGVGTAAEASELASSVTRSITDVELTGVTIERREYYKGKMYSMAKLAIDANLNVLINNVITNAFSNQESLLTQFKAKQGFEELDKQLDKMKSNQ